MARTTAFPKVLWIATSAWLTGCGRLGFDDHTTGQLAPLPDAAIVDAVALDAPPDVALRAVLQVAPSLALTAPCGSQAAEIELPITNTGNTDLVIESATLDNVPSNQFTLTQVPTTVAPGATEMLSVSPRQAVIGTDRGGTVFSNKLTIATNGGTQVVELSATVMGANIQIITPTTDKIAFTGSSGACPASGQTVSLSNTGNVGVNIAQLVASGFAFTGFASGVLPAGGSTSTTVRPFTLDTGQCSATASFAYEAASGTSGSTGGICTTAVILDVTLVITQASSSTSTSSSAASCFCS